MMVFHRPLAKGNNLAANENDIALRVQPVERMVIRGTVRNVVIERRGEDEWISQIIL